MKKSKVVTAPSSHGDGVRPYVIESNGRLAPTAVAITNHLLREDGGELAYAMVPGDSVCPQAVLGTVVSLSAQTCICRLGRKCMGSDVSTDVMPPSGHKLPLPDGASSDAAVTRLQMVLLSLWRLSSFTPSCWPPHKWQCASLASTNRRCLMAKRERERERERKKREREREAKRERERERERERKSEEGKWDKLARKKGRHSKMIRTALFLEENRPFFSKHKRTPLKHTRAHTHTHTQKSKTNPQKIRRVSGQVRWPLPPRPPRLTLKPSKREKTNPQKIRRV